MKKRILSMIMCVVMAGTLMVGTTGCGKKEDATTEVETTKENKKDTEEATTEEPDIGPEGMKRSALTGEWIDEDLAVKRPVAFMIENTSMSIPSHNSSKADIYYEAPEEGGITRIMALFNDYTGMSSIGNIRSTRPYFVYAAIAFDSMLAHCGGSIETYNELLDPGKVDNLDERIGSKGFFRSSGKGAPHNLYAESEGIEKAIEEHGYDTIYKEDHKSYFKFNKDGEHEIELEDGIDAAVVKVYQSDCKPWFEYNEEDGLYYRYEFGKAQMDAVNEVQLAVKNVIIQECTVDAYFDEQNHDRVDVGITKGGHGWYLTNGKAIEVTWECKGKGEVTHYFDKNGDEIVLNQGKTWINVMDVNMADKNTIFATKEDFEASK